MQEADVAWEEGVREKTISSKYLYRGRILDLRLDTVSLADGREAKREIVEHKGAVGILPIAADGNVILVRQFRKAVESFTWEVPAGTLEADENPLQCLHRELREETGLAAGRILRLAGYYSAIGFCTEFITVYAALDLTSGDTDFDDDEYISSRSFPAAEALAMIDEGLIVDGKTIIALLQARAQGLLQVTP